MSEYEDTEIRATVRQCQLITPQFRSPTEDDVLACHCTSDDTPTLKKTPIAIHRATPNQLASIEEEPPPCMKPTLDMNTIIRKLSNVSCHKRERGLVRKQKQREELATEQRGTKGLQRCRVYQNDSGASHTITPYQHTLLNFRPIDPIPVAGLEKDTTALHATGTGKLAFTSDEGDVLLIDALYTPDAETVLISPTAITKQY